jgi:hypothetical protein
VLLLAKRVSAEVPALALFSFLDYNGAVCGDMSHHLFILSPSDTPVYSMIHQSTKPAPSTAYPLAANLPSWSTSAFAGTLTALSGATSAAYNQNTGANTGAPRNSGQDRHVIQMIAFASLDVIEDVMRRENAM